MENLAFWIDSFYPFYLSKFICCSSRSLYRLFSSIIIRLINHYDKPIGTYLHEFLIVLLLEFLHVLRSLAGISDLFDGPLVFKFEQSHSVPQVKHIFLDPKESLRYSKYTYCPFCFLTCSRRVPVPGDEAPLMGVCESMLAPAAPFSLLKPTKLF